ncbi:hypothetical protein FDZ58_04010 [Ehrlichia ruminantium]|uniref:Uncharacterized protein n=3 Tax=Ehrlichia ruminantium TaxID=779 RepID=A0A0H3M6L9_EHRRW|nr:hypothetical protein FDZ68_04005 [Ehrlichia ruminantium]CAI27244.1 Hypothetical protein ERWE_CDS_07500 [Ehrlichia ruminantium str. Welgevonden]QLK51719.1 hypothetical protein FDZ66_04005 [Ehrlichia ruminantium]QLK53557.1 hypothetical protein FDZ64_04005 [Ehrlichia ruminantium]QLK55396.1 hypothetical protein FDZ62_04010 [Ehrlichia ruminantium]
MCVMYGNNISYILVGIILVILLMILLTVIWCMYYSFHSTTSCNELDKVELPKTRARETSSDITVISDGREDSRILEEEIESLHLVMKNVDVQQCCECSSSFGVKWSHNDTSDKSDVFDVASKCDSVEDKVHGVISSQVSVEPVSDSEVESFVNNTKAEDKVVKAAQIQDVPDSNNSQSNVGIIMNVIVNSVLDLSDYIMQ